MIIDWSVPFRLETPDGNITFNNVTDQVGPFLVSEACVAQYQVRSSKDNIPQADGSIIHRKFKTGYEIGLTVELWQSDVAVACGPEVSEMGDELDGLLSSLLNPPDQLGRLVWTPRGGTARMFNEVSLMNAPVAQQPDDAPIRVVFTLETAFPYAMEEAEQDETTAPGTSTITVPGNTPTWPVLRVQGGGGGVSTFIVSNVDLGAALYYDGATIPAGQYLEINMFNNTAFLNGDGANYIAGFDPELSDFFPLLPGDNQIDINTATVDWLINGAWA